MSKFFFDSTWNRLLERVWKRKVKKPVDYLYLKWGEKEFGRICVKECNVAGMNTLEISFVPSGRKKGETDIWGNNVLIETPQVFPENSDFIVIEKVK